MRAARFSVVTTGSVEKLLPGGEGLVRSGDQVALVHNVIPGDRVVIEMLSRRRGVQRARLVKLEEAGASRIAAACSVADDCGGCALQFLDPAQHARVKSQWVHDAFEPLMGQGCDWAPIREGKLHPRRRVTWHVGRDREGWFLGFFAPASHRAVRQRQCMVLTSRLQALRQQFESMDLKGIDRIQATELADGIQVVLHAGTQPRLTDMDAILDLPVNLWWQDGARLRPLARPVHAMHDRLPLLGDGHREIAIEVPPDGFVQGQFKGNRELVLQIQQWAGKPRRVADLFCGAGNLSLPLAVATGASISGAEGSQSSIRMARLNASRLGVDARLECLNLFEDFDPEPYAGCDLMILDPPRRGARRICTHIGRFLPRRVIMVSCDVAAGARDGALLARQGYRLRALKALDLFAYAGHVEALSLWELQ